MLRSRQHDLNDQYAAVTILLQATTRPIYRETVMSYEEFGELVKAWEDINKLHWLLAECIRCESSEGDYFYDQLDEMERRCGEAMKYGPNNI